MTDEAELRDENHELSFTLGDIEDLVDEKLARIRLGAYSEKQDGNLQEVLEEIERILR